MQRDALDTATNENLRALAYSIAQRNVAERIANMGGVVVVDDERKARGSSKKKQQADRPSSRVRLLDIFHFFSWLGPESTLHGMGGRYESREMK